MEVSRDVRPCVLMTRGPRAFSRDCTEDSDIPLSCEMKDEPAFKQLQGNPIFFRVRTSQYPLHMRQKTQDKSQINIAEGRLLLMCLRNVGLPLEKNPWNQLSSRENKGCIELSSSSCAEIGIPTDLRWVSQGMFEVAQRKPSQLSCMMGNGVLL